MPIASNIYYHYYEGSAEGQNPTLILIHGAGGNHLYWHPQLRRLADYRVFAPDLPGHGKSGGHGQQSIAAYVESLLAWMDAIDIYSAVLIGHSMGSAIAMTMILDHPQRASGLVLIGAGARLSVNSELLEATSSNTTYHNAVDNIVRWSFSPHAPPQLTEQATKRMMETRPSVLHGDLLACDSFDETERLGRIYKPTLVICGADDKMTPPRFSQYLTDNIPNAQLKIIPQAGHMVMLEQPQLVREALLDFLPTITI